MEGYWIFEDDAPNCTYVSHENSTDQIVTQEEVDGGDSNPYDAFLIEQVSDMERSFCLCINNNLSQLQTASSIVSI